MSELALKLIAENKASRDTFLDLGNCGLTELPQELAELTHLEVLVLSDVAYLWKEEKQVREWVRSKNKNKTNILLNISVLSALPNLRELYCKGTKHIIEISILSNFSKLQVLDISFNQIYDISGLTLLNNLEQLWLSHNQIEDITPLSSLYKLKILIISHNRIQNISSISKLTNLWRLNLSHNQIENILPLANLIKLKRLWLGSNHIKDISVLTNLVELKQLDISTNQVQDISGLSHLISLEKLTLKSNQVQSIKPIAKLIQLKDLNISFNKIKDISSVENLIKLERFLLKSNQVFHISPLINLISLRELHISANQITDISDVSKLVELQRLYISSNRIQDISSLAKLVKLRELDISSNQIQDIYGVIKLVKLRKLDISSNQVEAIFALSNLINLQVLNMSSNYVRDISHLVNLIELNQLDIYQNQIQDISALANLRGLKTLFASENEITNIDILVNHKQIKLLDIAQNQIRDLRYLTHIYKKNAYIKISDNPLLHPPLEVVERGKPSIIAYLEALQSGKELQFLREAKVVIIGEGGTGKSSLLQKMKDKDNELPKETERTRGIEVAPLHFQDKEGNDFQMNVWDFGGQGIYQATHQFFLSKRSLYILLDDTRRSDSTLQDPTFNYWLQVSELYGGESPLLIVQNEKEDFSKQINFADMQQRFSFVKALYATNLKKTNKDWKRLQHDIQEFLCQLPHIGTWMRKEWVEIRKVLLEKAEKRDFIAWEEYEEICQEKGIDKEAEMLLLSALLHDLGTILHFQDNSLLKQRLILKKEWATEAIYKVLDCEIIKQDQKGRFSETDLARIWDDKKWKNSIPQLLALMAEFEICYLLEDKKPKTYLAPLLLPAETPEYEWEKQGTLVLRYKYRFMPQGILSRLIVRLHRFVKDTDKAWKTGVLLYHENTAVAEVRDMYGESEIRISIKGKEKKEFMHLIRSELDALNATFPFQDFPDREKAVRKLIPCVCDTCQQAQYPHYYEYDDLQRRIEKKKKTVECKISYEDVPVKNVLDAVLYSEKVSLAKEIREFVGKGELEKALNILRKYEETSKRDETILISARHAFFMRDKLNLDVEDKTERNKIAEALLAICKELEAE